MIVIDTSAQKVFAPAGKYACLVGKDRDAAMNLMVDKKNCQGSITILYFFKGIAVKHTKQSDR